MWEGGEKFFFTAAYSVFNVKGGGDNLQKPSYMYIMGGDNFFNPTDDNVKFVENSRSFAADVNYKLFPHKNLIKLPYNICLNLPVFTLKLIFHFLD